jgi:hypothetical protein
LVILKRPLRAQSLQLSSVPAPANATGAFR